MLLWYGKDDVGDDILEGVVVAWDDVGVGQLDLWQAHHLGLAGVEASVRGSLQFIQGGDDIGAIVAFDYNRTTCNTREGDILAAASCKRISTAQHSTDGDGDCRGDGIEVGKLN